MLSAGRRLCALAAAAGGAAAAASAAAATAPPYTLAATQSCLTKLPNAVAGLPPTTPPVPARLFVYALAHDDIATWGVGQTRPHVHRQLGAWYGNGNYEGIILSFFRNAAAARASLTSRALDGAKLVRNVVVTWDQTPEPSRSVRTTVLGCLRAGGSGGLATKRPAPAATLATFEGRWGGHTRGLMITPTREGREAANDGCCRRVYQLTFQIRSVSGTLTRAAAVYRVTSFKRYESGVRRLHVGDIGKLILRDGIVTNTLTGDFFCSDPAWGATGACGA